MLATYGQVEGQSGRRGGRDILDLVRVAARVDADEHKVALRAQELGEALEKVGGVVAVKVA